MFFSTKHHGFEPSKYQLGHCVNTGYGQTKTYPVTGINHTHSYLKLLEVKDDKLVHVFGSIQNEIRIEMGIMDTVLIAIGYLPNLEQ